MVLNRKGKGRLVHFLRYCLGSFLLFVSLRILYAVKMTRFCAVRSPLRQLVLSLEMERTSSNLMANEKRLFVMKYMFLSVKVELNGF